MDGDAQAIAITDFLLQVAFPDPRARAVRAAGIGEDEQSIGARIVFPATGAPPSVNGIDRKGGSLPSGTDHHHAGIAPHIINPVWERNPDRVGTEVMIVDLPRLQAPPAPVVLEVGD